MHLPLMKKEEHMPTPLLKAALDTPTLKRQTQDLCSEKSPQETKGSKGVCGRQDPAHGG